MKNIIKSIIKFVGLVIFVVCLTEIWQISDKAFLYAIGVCIGVVLIAIANIIDLII